MFNEDKNFQSFFYYGAHFLNNIFWTNFLGTNYEKFPDITKPTISKQSSPNITVTSSTQVGVKLNSAWALSQIWISDPPPQLKWNKRYCIVRTTFWGLRDGPRMSAQPLRGTLRLGMVTTCLPRLWACLVWALGHTYFRQFLGIYQAYIRNVLSISYKNVELFQVNLKHISRKSQAPLISFSFLLHICIYQYLVLVSNRPEIV